MAKCKDYILGYAPDRRRKVTMFDFQKKEIQTKADDFVKKVLAPMYIQPPPKNPEFNYPVELWTKWYRGLFYFGSTWVSPFPDQTTSTFEVRFARLEYVGDNHFNVAYFRHSKEWCTVFTDLTLDECLQSIGDGGPFTLV